jgi:RHH-type transcriptional regulator, proline utilization regulon repressor / proline dehydrogenase / delta 1-pyrroline-5-carboxylate dehydrogenase
MAVAPPGLRSGVSRQVETNDVEARVKEIGRALFADVGRGPSLLDRGWWDDRMMSLTMSDPEVKVQLFRFIDALPALGTPESVVEHLRDYLEQAGHDVPWWLRSAVELAPAGTLRGEILAWSARTGAGHMARRFIAGSTPTEAFRTVLALRHRHLAFTADLLGEAVISEAEAETYAATCVDLLRGLASPLAMEAEDPQIDRDDRGPIPRANLSLKLTSLTPHFDAIREETTTHRVLERLRPILRVARAAGAFVNIDMEQYIHKDLTYAIFRRVMSEPEFRDWPDVGIVAQAYLPEAEADLAMLADWVAERGTPLTIRLVKGAYWDYEVTHARQVGWPVPVYPEKWATDACYERCSRFLLAHHDQLRPAFGSHNVRSVAHAMAVAEALGVPRKAYEVQMLYGMGEPIQRALIRRGVRVRVYTPYGALLPGMAYLVRRLLENTSNESFLKASFTDRAAVDDLLRNPEETGKMWRRRPKVEPKSEPGALSPFVNEPLTDFSRPENRDAMRLALADVKSRLGQTYPIRIGGRLFGNRPDAVRDASTDPCDQARVVGWTPRGTLGDADAAVSAARAAFPAWAATPPRIRAEVLVRAAAIMRRRRLELAAWEIFECAKPWREADADIAEAIDFCEFYAREMVRLASPLRRDVPGETNAIERIARGVAVIIPPWNFPLAIPCGMTVAALVAGNAAILKPAEQATVITAQLAAILEEAGLPPGVFSYLPGLGEEVGQALVDDPRVDIIAFTGSRPVGLEINRRASDTKPGQDHVKRVIAEMGGKNAIIVDDDADLDEAVVGVIQSAFGYGGQKCSACSRVIVLDGVHDAFVTRLTEAARAVVVGPAEEPETMVPALIDPDARDRVLRYAQIAIEQGARAVVATPVGSLAEHGNFVGPHVFAGVKPTDRLAQEEIFGPVLAVIRARDLGEALSIANGTEYALTGGIFSRSPANLERAKREFLVGNLYINRAITGALVDRQPFGGFKLSGMGSKAGGTEYLNEFLYMRTVTENTMRRGFAPEDEATNTPITAAAGT